MENVTEEQIDALADKWHDETIARIQTNLGTPVDPNASVVQDGLKAILHELGEDEEQKREIEVFDSPLALLRDCKERDLDGIGVARLYQLSWILACQELEEETPDAAVVAQREFAFSVFDGIIFEKSVCLVGYPSVYETDEDGELHCETGPALSWPGQDEYFWHGQSIDAEAITAPDTLTAEYLLGLPAEKRRATYEAIGHERAVAALGLKVFHAEEIEGLKYELYKSDEECWLKMQSPPLQDGSQPFYLEPVHEDCTTCREALGWRATGDQGVVVSYEIET